MVVLQSCTVNLYSVTAKICKMRAGECLNGSKNVTVRGKTYLNAYLLNGC